MKYIRIDSDIVAEIIPGVDAAFPGVPIDERYPAEFVATLMEVSDDTQVEQNWVYNAATHTFSEPPEPEPIEWEEPEPIEPEPKADIAALIADVAEVQAAIDAFLEEVGSDG